MTAWVVNDPSLQILKFEFLFADKQYEFNKDKRYPNKLYKLFLLLTQRNYFDNVKILHNY